jgi:hypothetical protein
MPMMRGQSAQESVMLSFADSSYHRIDQIIQLSESEWQQLHSWLHRSGLALYFLDRIKQLGLSDAIPAGIIDGLQKNQNDNVQRTRGMIDESIAIQQELQAAKLSYAVMKGLSLCPSSVSRPELRHQFDLDYLIAEQCAPDAKLILEHMGYRVHAISRKSWEFKKNETPKVSAKDLYKDLPYCGVELHLDSTTPAQASRLDRVVWRKMHGIDMPMFSPVDLFLGQGMHAFKDICSPFSRASHLLEFYRHVLTMRNNDEFWNELGSRAKGDRNISLGIGVVTDLITSILGDFAPTALTEWTVDELSPSIRLWVDRYGRRAIFSSPPGTKLHLLLQTELQAEGISLKQPLKQSLLPARLPPPVIQGSPGESVSTRITRYRVQLRFILSRLRFHLIEGLRYAAESRRWRQLLKRLPK